MKKFVIILLWFPIMVLAQTKYQTDFDHFLNDFTNHYVYLESQGIDIEKIRAYYKAEVAAIKSDNDFIALLEKVTYEFYNGHIMLNTNTEDSNRVIPSGSDIFAVKSGNTYLISDVRVDSPAEKSGIKSGMELITFNGQNISEAIKPFLPKTVTNYTPAMYRYAINMLLAGNRNTPRNIIVYFINSRRQFLPDIYKPTPKTTLLNVMKDKSGNSYIKINDALGNTDLIPAFDKALDSLLDSKAITLDLRETPSGGNTTVARGIMGRFITKEMPYQVHEYTEMPSGIVRKWVELASPRGKTYTGKLIVMVSHWTGSMGEGMAIGFDGMKRGTVVGTRMAGLLGANYSYRLPETNIGYSIPGEILYHINGIPREDYIPEYLTKNSIETLLKAMELENEK